MERSVGELSQSEYEALPPAQRAAVTNMLLDIEAGRLHPATSEWDLTPAELVFERRALSLGRIEASARGLGYERKS